MPKITELPSGIPTTADVLPLVQGSTTKKATFNDLPVAAATQTALNLKADAANANLTGTTNTNNLVVGGTLSGAGVTKTAVGLGNVDNTSDVNKPVSTTQATAISTAVSAVVGAFKNKIRNPKMEIAHRGTSLSVGAGQSSYTLDGWLVTSGGTAVLGVSQSTDVPANAEYQYSLRITVNTADATVGAGEVVTIKQVIEGYLVRDLLGNPVALRFDVRSPKTGTHSVALRNSGGDRSYILTYTVNAANTWETKTLTLPGGLISAGTWNFTNGIGLIVEWTLMVGSTFQGAAGSWLTGTFWGTSAQPNCVDTIGNIFAIGCPQLEKGTTSTALEHRDSATELVLNQRYYQEIGTPGGNDLVLGGYMGTSGTCYHTFVYPVRMRTSPTAGNGGVSFTVTGLTGASFAIVGPCSMRLDLANSGAAGFYIWQNASAGCRLTLSAEL